MAKTINIKIGNLKSFNAMCKRLESQLPKVAEEVVTAGTLAIERDAKINCPVDTGRLRDSIHSEVETDNTGSTGSVGTNVDYGPHVELGTTKMAAQPFLKPAYDGNKDDIVKLAHEKVKEVIRKK